MPLDSALIIYFFLPSSSFLPLTGLLYVDHKGGDLSKKVLPNNADATQCANLCKSTSKCTYDPTLVLLYWILLITLLALLPLHILVVIFFYSWLLSSGWVFSLPDVNCSTTNTCYLKQGAVTTQSVGVCRTAGVVNN